MSTEQLDFLRAKDVWDPSDWMNYLVQIRKQLEKHSMRKKAPTLSAYCDWAQHSMLDRNVVLVSLLNDMTDVLIETDRARDISLFMRGVAGCLRTRSLRHELVEVDAQLGLRTPKGILRRSKWMNSFGVWRSRP